MRLPASLHPANHFHVQCLLLQLGLCADPAAVTAMGQSNRRDLYRMARRLARSEAALEERHLSLRGPSQPQPPPTQQQQQQQMRLGPAGDEPAKVRGGGGGWRAIAQALRGFSDCCPSLPPPSPPRTQQTSETQPGNFPASASAAFFPAPALLSASSAASLRPPSSSSSLSAAGEMAFTPPARLVALYAPRTLLPQLPHDPYHDNISYDAAVGHVALLTQLLRPYGMEVSLTGVMRRGCPVSSHAELLLSLTEKATREVEAVQAMLTSDTTSMTEAVRVSYTDGVRDTHAEEEENEDSLCGGRGGRGGLVGHAQCTTHAVPGFSLTTTTQRAANRPLLRDALTLPIAASTAFAREAADGRGASTTSTVHAGTPTRHCSCAHAFAASDVVSPQVAFRTQRAIDSLIQHGYVVAGQVPALSAAFLSRRLPLHVSVRYDTLSPSLVPPRECTDPVVLRRLQLHRLTLSFCPWQARPTRSLFLTGPPAFAAHVTLQALAHGIDLNFNGAFVAVKSPRERLPCSDVNSPAATAAAATPTAGDGDAAAVVVRDTEAISAVRSGEGNEGGSTHTPAEDRGVAQVLIKEEAAIFELAGMPVVDPVLRGVYCQVHKLD